MTKLVWDRTGERLYETGVDRGVLFIGTSGVAWNGIVSVSESPSGGDPRPFYLDGIKYLNLAAAEEYAASLSAFYRPLEFAPCDGFTYVQNGLFATQQRRQPFNLTYRTLLGNDLEAQDFGYKIHLVYNALAAPPQIDHSTIEDTVNVTPFSWDLTTLPPSMNGFRPTSHFVIDSSLTDLALLSDVEDILYGTDALNPAWIDAQDLIDMFAP